MDYTRRLKRTNYLALGLVAVLVLAVLVWGLVGHERRTFRTEKWIADPEHRTQIVDDLLAEHELVGMTEEVVIALLGEHNNDYGYFLAEDRFIYYLGPERGLFSIDSEWLILDFSDGIVSDCFLTRD